MPKLISSPSIIKDEKNKIIKEYIGCVNSMTQSISIARMVSPPGWAEPGQTPEFDEYTLVLKGTLEVQHKNGTLKVNEGQAVITNKGEWVKYGTPNGAEYVAVCVPAFTPSTVHRD